MNEDEGFLLKANLYATKVENLRTIPMDVKNCFMSRLIHLIHKFCLVADE